MNCSGFISYGGVTESIWQARCILGARVMSIFPSTTLYSVWQLQLALLSYWVYEILLSTSQAHWTLCRSSQCYKIWMGMWQDSPSLHLSDIWWQFCTLHLPMKWHCFLIYCFYRGWWHLHGFLFTPFCHNDSHFTGQENNAWNLSAAILFLLFSLK